MTFHSQRCQFPLSRLYSIHDSPLLKVEVSCKSFTHTSEPSDTSCLIWLINFYARRTENDQLWLLRVMHPHPHSFLGTGTWGHDLHCRKDEGWLCMCVCVCACAVMAQWEVDDECFWLDNWFAPVFTFNLGWAWSVEGSQSGTAGFNLNGSSKSHRKLCHSPSNAYWEFIFIFKLLLQVHRNCEISLS